MIIEVHYIQPIGKSASNDNSVATYRKFEDLDVAKKFASNLDQSWYRNPYIRIVRGSQVSIIKYYEVETLAPHRNRGYSPYLDRKKVTNK